MMSCLGIINSPSKKSSSCNKNWDFMTKMSGPNLVERMAEWELMSNKEEKLIYLVRTKNILLNRIYN